MVNRLITSTIKQKFFRGKAIIVVGPRQVGKTTLLKMLANEYDRKVLVWNCDEPDVRRKLTDPTSTMLGNETAGYDIVFIDEAQRVQNIGITLKLLIDNYPGKQVVVTGSSAIERTMSLLSTLPFDRPTKTSAPFTASASV